MEHLEGRGDSVWARPRAFLRSLKNVDSRSLRETGTDVAFSDIFESLREETSRSVSEIEILERKINHLNGSLRLVNY
jgi:hypothetical protein